MMKNENEVRRGIQQAKVGEIGLGVVAIEIFGLAYYAGHATESMGLGLLAFIVLIVIFFGVSNDEKVSAWFSLIMGGVVAVVLFAASVIEGENTLLVGVLMSLLVGSLVIGGNFAGLQHLRDLSPESDEDDKDSPINNDKT